MKGSLPSRDAFVDQVCRSTVGVSDPMQWCVLVDPTVRDPLNDLSHGLSAPPERYVAAPSINSNIRPYFARGENVRDNERMLSASFSLAFDEMAEGSIRTVCAWIRVGADPLEVKSAAISLGKAMVVTSPKRATPFVFRFFDPRLSEGLTRIVGLDGWCSLVGELSGKWWTPDPDQGAVCLGYAPSLGVPSRSEPVTLSANEYDQIMILGWVNRIQSAAYRWPLESTPAPEELRYVVQSALNEGCSTDEDVLAFAHACLNHHPQFFRHPCFKAIRKQISHMERRSYAWLIEQVDPAAWREIAQWECPADASLNRALP